MSNLLQTGAEFEKKLKERAESTEKMLNDEFRKLGESVSEAVTSNETKIRDAIALFTVSTEKSLEKHREGVKEAMMQHRKDTKEKVTADEMMDDLIYLAELIDFMGITSCLAVRGTLSERMTDKLTDSIAGMADEVLEKWEDYQDKTE